jgi:hypothetical protein
MFSGEVVEGSVRYLFPVFSGTAGENLEKRE